MGVYSGLGELAHLWYLEQSNDVIWQVSCRPYSLASITLCSRKLEYLANCSRRLTWRNRLAGIAAGRKLYVAAAKSVMNSPVSFFDTTPLGQ